MNTSIGVLSGALFLVTACGGGPAFEHTTGASELVAREAEQPREAAALVVAKQAVPAFRFSIHDGADGQPTTISELKVQVRSQVDASRWSWGLESSLGRLPGSVKGVVGQQLIQFEAAGVRVADGAALECLLTLQGDPGPDAPDNATFELEIAGRDQTLAAGSTPLPPDARAENRAGVRYTVAATELRVLEQPPASLSVGEPFALVAAFTDALGHVDVDVNGDEVSALRADDASPVGTAVALNGVVRFRDERALILLDPPNISLSLQLLDGVSGALDLSAAPVSTTALSLSGGNDADARLEASDALAEPLQLDLSQVQAGPVDVLDFKLVDGGGGDGLSCTVVALDFVVVGSGLEQEHRFWLRGPGIDFPLAGQLLQQGDMGLISFEELPIDVPEGAAATYTLAIELSPEHVEVGDTLLFALGSDSVQSYGTTVSAGDVSNAPGLVLTGQGPVLSLNGADPTALAGGQTALVVEDTCGELEVVIGYRMSAKYQGNVLVSSAQTLCGELQLPSLATDRVWVWPGSALAQRGHDGTEAHELSCPADEVVVGLHGGAGAALDSFGIDCAPLLLTSEPLAVTLGPVTSLAAEGGEGGLAYSLSCPGGGVARGTRTRVLDAQTDFGFVSLEALGLICAQVELN